MKKKIHPVRSVRAQIHTNGSTFFGGVGQAQLAMLASGIRQNSASTDNYSNWASPSLAQLWGARTSSYAFLHALLASKAAGLNLQRLRLITPKKEHLARQARLLNLGPQPTKDLINDGLVFSPVGDLGLPTLSLQNEPSKVAKQTPPSSKD